MVDTGTPRQSELETAMDHLEVMLQLFIAARSRVRYWTNKSDRARARNEDLAAGEAPRENPGNAEPWPNVEETGPAESFEGDEQVGVRPQTVNGNVTDSLEGTDQRAVLAAAPLNPEQKAFFDDEDAVSWLRHGFGAEVSPNGESIVFHGSDEQGLSAHREAAWNLITAQNLRDGYDHEATMGELDLPVSIAYLQGNVDEYGTVGYTVPADQGNPAQSLRIRLEDQHFVAYRQIDLSEARNYDLTREELSAAVAWYGGRDAVDGETAWFPITDNGSAGVKAIAHDHIAPALSDARSFEDALKSEDALREAARAERMFFHSDKVLPASLYEQPWGPNGINEITHGEVKLDNGHTAAIWVKDGKAGTHPDGLPSLILDENRKIVAAGHFEQGHPTGEWAFTESERTYTAERAIIDPKTGEASEVFTRESRQDPFSRTPELDGTKVLGGATTATIVSAGVAKAAELGMGTLGAGVTKAAELGMGTLSAGAQFLMGGLDSQQPSGPTLKGPR